MKRRFILAMLFAVSIAGSLAARGFGGAGRGGGALSGDSGGWGDGAYGAGLPWFESMPGWDVAYGGAGAPRLDMPKRAAAYNPLAGEQAISAPQGNVEAQQRQAFVGSLAGMGIGTGGFQPGEFGPPPKEGLPSDMGLHQAGGTGAYGYARGGSGGSTADDGTRNWTAAELRVLGNSVRSAFRTDNVFNRNWYAQHPKASSTRGYVRDVWSGADWATVTSWFGSDWPSYTYMYGSELVYEGDRVYLYGRPMAAADKYYDSAKSLAQKGARAAANGQRGGNNSEWLPLGVFEAIRGTGKSSTMLFQLAVNKDGIVRGNYFDTADNNVQLVEGALDKDTQRVAWVVADKPSVVFDCMLYNLTQPETSMLVHLGKDKNEQWTFVRLAQKAGGANR